MMCTGTTDPSTSQVWSTHLHLPILPHPHPSPFAGLIWSVRCPGRHWCVCEDSSLPTSTPATKTVAKCSWCFCDSIHQWNTCSIGPEKALVLKRIGLQMHFLKLWKKAGEDACRLKPHNVPSLKVWIKKLPFWRARLEQWVCSCFKKKSVCVVNGTWRLIYFYWN